MRIKSILSIIIYTGFFVMPFLVNAHDGKLDDTHVSASPFLYQNVAATYTISGDGVKRKDGFLHNFGNTLGDIISGTVDGIQSLFGFGSEHPSQIAVHSTQSEAEKTSTELTNTLQNAVSSGSIRTLSQDSAESQILESLASTRKENMKELAKTNPSLFLALALPRESRQVLPQALQEYVEEETTLRGTLEVIHVDDFKNYKNSHYLYFLNVIDSTPQSRIALMSVDQSGEPNIERIQLFPTDTIELISGSTIEVNGFRIDEIMVPRSGRTGLQALGTPPSLDSVGEQRVLALITEMKDHTSPISQADVERALFSEESVFQDFFLEQSYGKVWFTGDVYKLQLDRGVDPESCDSGVYIHNEDVRAALEEKGIDITAYDRVLFIPPIGYCSSVGKSNIYDVEYTTVTGRISQSWVGWHYIQYSHESGALSTTLAHEIGHALGVYHANSLTCPSGIVLDDTKCKPYEYGNFTDMMGYGRGHFNALLKDTLGWFDESQRTIVDSSGVYRLNALEEDSGVSMLLIENPFAKEAVFGAELRAPIGFDSHLVPNERGVFINARLPVLPVPGSYILDLDPDTSSTLALSGENTFTDKETGITFGPVAAIASTSADVAIRYGEAECIQHSPKLSISYVQESVTAGLTLYVNFQLLNTDTYACDASGVIYTFKVPDEWEFDVDEHTDILQRRLSPKEKMFGTFRFYIPKDAEVGTHTIAMTARMINGEKEGHTLQREITVIPPLILDSITPKRAEVGDEVVIHGSGFSTDAQVYLMTLNAEVRIENPVINADSIRFRIPATIYVKGNKQQSDIFLEQWYTLRVISDFGEWAFLSNALFIEKSLGGRRENRKPNDRLDNRPATRTNYIIPTRGSGVTEPPSIRSLRFEKGSIILSWNNPPSEEFDSVLIVRSTGGYAQSPTEGDIVFESSAKVEEWRDPNTQIGVRYYYTVYTVADSVLSEPVFGSFIDSGGEDAFVLSERQSSRVLANSSGDSKQSYNLSNIPQGSYIETTRERNPYAGFTDTYITTETLRAPDGTKIITLRNEGARESALIEAYDPASGRYVELTTERNPTTGVYSSDRSIYDAQGGKLINLGYSNGGIKTTLIGYNPSTGQRIEKVNIDNTTSYNLVTPQGGGTTRLPSGTLPSGFVAPETYLQGEGFYARNAIDGLYTAMSGAYSGAYSPRTQQWTVAEFDPCNIVSLPLEYLGDEGDEFTIIAGGENTHTNVSQGVLCNTYVFNVIEADDFNRITDDDFNRVASDDFSVVQGGGTQPNGNAILESFPSGDKSDEAQFGNTTFKDFVLYVVGLINLILPVLLGLALLLFFWGLAKFINKANNVEEIANGKQLMVWGIISLFVMVSIWGILQFLLSDVGASLVIPQLPTGR